MGLLRILPLLVLAACFAPAVGDGSFACEVDESCPPGFSCRPCDRRCWRDPTVACGSGFPDGAPKPDAPLVMFDASVPADGPLPDVAEPDVPMSEPDASEPDAFEPDASEPDAPMSLPDAAEVPDAPLPDAPKPDAAIPDAKIIDGPATPDARVPDARPPDAGFTCGNGTCEDWLGENCKNCEDDCGACHVTCIANLLCLPISGDNCVNCPDGCGACTTCNNDCLVMDDCRLCPSDCPASCN